MRVRAIRDLCQLPDRRLFDELATGLRLVLTNAKRLQQAAKRLHKDGRVQASEVLDNVAAEEAAKFMIMIDAVRCPKSELGRQLSWFNHHLAKGIYSEYYETSPATFGEVRKAVERWRPTLYLDGPNDVDFILR